MMTAEKRVEIASQTHSRILVESQKFLRNLEEQEKLIRILERYAARFSSELSDVDNAVRNMKNALKQLHTVRNAASTVPKGEL